jgi:hypothetical protein
VDAPRRREHPSLAGDRPAVFLLQTVDQLACEEDVLCRITEFGREMLALLERG